MGRSATHPVTGHVYATTADGLVEVTDPATGRRGLFDENAVWQSGELTYADRHLAGWVGRLSRRLAAARSTPDQRTGEA